jgi:putative oxidoreductase
MPSWLTALPQLADLALLILRLVIGGMFAMSGFFKLTDGERRQKMAESLVKAGVPASLTPAMSAAELVGGVLVLLGLLTVGGAAILLVISLGALVTTSLPKAEGEGIHKLENILYTPEALLAAGLLVLVATGAGGWSLDALLR